MRKVILLIVMQMSLLSGFSQVENSYEQYMYWNSRYFDDLYVYQKAVEDHKKADTLVFYAKRVSYDGQMVTYWFRRYNREAKIQQNAQKRSFQRRPDSPVRIR